jgi:hypothetical protein
MTKQDDELREKIISILELEPFSKGYVRTSAFLISNDDIEALEALIKDQVRLARINELENFQWNDAHMYVRTRLDELTEKEEQ